MGTIVWAWPVKRAIFARLAAISDGSKPAYPGTELLVADGDDNPVQVSLFLPAEPDRICIFGTSVSFSRRVIGGDGRPGDLTQGIAVLQDEIARIEVRVRVYEPGEDFESVDRKLGDLCSAVASAVLAERFGSNQGPQITVSLTGGSQDPTAMAGSPEPSVTGNASLTFSAEVVIS